jgi:hypothetical protein
VRKLACQVDFEIFNDVPDSFAHISTDATCDRTYCSGCRSCHIMHRVKLCAPKFEMAVVDFFCFNWYYYLGGTWYRRFLLLQTTFSALSQSQLLSHINGIRVTMTEASTVTTLPSWPIICLSTAEETTTTDAFEGKNVVIGTSH